MDVPEGRAGGPAAQSRCLGPLFTPREDEEGAVGEWVPACGLGTWERRLGVPEPPLCRRVGGRELSLMKCPMCTHPSRYRTSFALGEPQQKP